MCLSDRDLHTVTFREDDRWRTPLTSAVGSARSEAEGCRGQVARPHWPMGSRCAVPPGARLHRASCRWPGTCNRGGGCWILLGRNRASNPARQLSTPVHSSSSSTRETNVSNISLYECRLWESPRIDLLRIRVCHMSLTGAPPGPPPDHARCRSTAHTLLPRHQDIEI